MRREHRYVHVDSTNDWIIMSTSRVFMLVWYGGKYLITFTFVVYYHKIQFFGNRLGRELLVSLIYHKSWHPSAILDHIGWEKSVSQSLEVIAWRSFGGRLRSILRMDGWDGNHYWWSVV